MRSLALHGLLGALLVSSFAATATAQQAVVASVAAITRQWQRSLPRPGKRDKVVLRRGRADALSRALALVSSQNASERRAATDALIAFAGAEPARALEMFVVAALTRLERSLTQAQVARFAAARQRVFPLAPPTPRTGNLVVRQYVGDEFFKGQVASYRRAGYALSGVTDTVALAKRGRIVVKLSRGDKDIFREMADPAVHVVMFSGHSDIGGVVEQALGTAPAQRGQKLVVLLQCVGTQTLPMVAVKYEEAHVLTTHTPSYDDLDQNLTLALMESLHSNETYAQLRTRARRGGAITNYVFPDDPTEAASWDLDRDGRLDLAAGQLWDRTFNVADLRTKPAGHTLLSAVGYINSAHRYYAEDTPGAVFKERDALDRYAPAGIGGTATSGVTVFQPRQVAGKSVFAVALDPRYAGLSRNVLASAILYDVHLHLVRAVRGQVTERDHLRALFFVGDYLYRLVAYSDEADTAMRAFTRLKGLPVLSYPEVEAIIFLDPSNSATDAQLDALGRLLAKKRSPGR